jgi:hypothetical protein
MIESVCGIPADYFSAFFRMFNEVFLQDSHGSYRSRVSEFAPRLLFVVGGNDPIVTTRSVLAASPAEGINMIEIAKLGHFVALSRGEWRDFWLPAIARLLYSFADRASILLSESVITNLWNADRSGPLEGKPWSKKKNSGLSIGREARAKDAEALNSESFQMELNSVADLLASSGTFLMVMRNQVPTALLGPRLLHRRGTVPHYEDSLIREYWEGLRERRELMLHHCQKIFLVVPLKLRDWFAKPPPILSVKSAPTARAIPTREGLQNVWDDFLTSWGETGALFAFHPEHPQFIPEGEPKFEIERLVRKRTRTEEPHPILNCLPDVWIFLSRSVVDGITGAVAGREAAERGFAQFVCSVYEEQSRELKPRTKELKTWLTSGELRLVRVSGADSNPRFLGERVREPARALDLLVHSALALARASQCHSKEEFLQL